MLELLSKLICEVVLLYKYRPVLFTAAVEAAVNQVSLVVGQDDTLSCEHRLSCRFLHQVNGWQL